MPDVTTPEKHLNKAAFSALPNHVDVVVVGAGVGGASAALHLARGGARVLLVERQQFPRYKVCGCCLNARAVGELRRMGLAQILADTGAVETTQFRLMAGGQVARLPLAGGCVLSREVLDQQLVQAACAAGVQFLEGVKAKLSQADHEGVNIRLHSGNESASLHSMAVVCAQGLHEGFSSAQDMDPPQIAAGARIGMGAVLPASDEIAAGVIYMACGAQGYAGMVRLEDGRINIAAAIDIQATRGLGPGEAIRAILESAGMPAPAGVLTAVWKGTPALTRSRLPAWNRVFFVGDAAGYVEPFTGEGMSWALAGGAAVARHVEALLRGAQGEEAKWAAHWRNLVARRQWTCRGLAWMLKHPGLTRLAVRAVAAQPKLAKPVIGSVHTERQGQQP